MGCDYYVQTDLVIMYYDNLGALSKTRTNIILEKGYLSSIPDEDSDDDEETQIKKWEEELERRIKNNTHKKMLYNDDKWVKDSYEKKYSKELSILCQKMVKLVKVYKDYYAWKRD